MISKNGNIMCDECGRYISVDHLNDGSALHHLLRPKSEFDWTEEYYESLCRIHYKNKLPVSETEKLKNEENSNQR